MCKSAHHSIYFAAICYISFEMFQEDYNYPIDEDIATASTNADAADANTNIITSDEINNYREEEDPSNLSPEIPKKQDQSKYEPHTKSVRTKRKWHDCNECDKSFKNPSTLVNHKSAVHHGIRPYPCEQCDKRFASIMILENHLLTHTGERRFKCDECDQSFTQSGTLAYHKQNIHQKIRPHACGQCDRSFFLAKDLRAHLLFHSGKCKTALSKRFQFHCQFTHQFMDSVLFQAKNHLHVMNVIRSSAN